MKIKNVVILGSTGSIGINALRVIARYPDRFKVVGLSAFNNFKLLEKQVNQFSPAHVAVSQKGITYLKNRLDAKKVKLHDAQRDLTVIAALPEVDVVVIGMSGSAALDPFLSAVRASKTIAPANKEALVIAGDIIISEAKKHKAKIIPVDSEQSAVFQCLEGNNRHELEKVILTASGGALRNVPKKQFDKLSVPDILNHPRWKMGKKITVDSATLMNKGFEIIEAKWLFDLKISEIEVLVHPEAIIHSMVRFKDGSILAQLGITDMRLPIQYALTYPERWNAGLKPVDFSKLQQLTFEKPDLKKFPSLALAIHTSEQGGTMPSVLNAADEEAVDAFLAEEILFSEIYKVVEKIVLKHKNKQKPTLSDILTADQWARQEAREFIKKVKG